MWLVLTGPKSITASLRSLARVISDRNPTISGEALRVPPGKCSLFSPSPSRRGQLSGGGGGAAAAIPWGARKEEGGGGGGARQKGPRARGARSDWGEEGGNAPAGPHFLPLPPVPKVRWLSEGVVRIATKRSDVRPFSRLLTG